MVHKTREYLASDILVLIANCPGPASAAKSQSGKALEQAGGAI